MEYPIVVGHRANSGRIVFWYKRVGVEYVEVDVTYKHGKLLVMHGPPGTRRATPIGRLAGWIDYKLFYRDPLLRPQPLHKWLRLVQERLDLQGVLVDLKSNTPPDTLQKELDKSGFTGKIMISTNDHRILPQLRETIPNALLIASFSIMPANPTQCARPSKAHGIGFRIDLLDKTTASTIKREGYILSSWTLNTPQDITKALELGVDILISDRPDIALQILRKKLAPPNKKQGASHNNNKSNY